KARRARLKFQSQSVPPARIVSAALVLGPAKLETLNGGKVIGRASRLGDRRIVVSGVRLRFAHRLFPDAQTNARSDRTATWPHSGERAIVIVGRRGLIGGRGTQRQRKRRRDQKIDQNRRQSVIGGEA